MESNYQILFNIVFTIAGAMAGFILKSLWSAMNELQRADTVLADKVASIEVLVAGQYVKRDYFESKVDALFVRLDQMETKFDHKLDQAFDRTNKCGHP